MKKDCYFNWSGECDKNCNNCNGANMAFQILLNAEQEKTERDKRYDKALHKK